MSGPAPLRVLGVIPARLQSTRLPRKVLRELAGKPLIVHVYEAARRAPDLGNLLVATDSQEVVDACATYGIPTMMTSAEHPSGTDRIWEVAQSRAADVYVNVQGDEPLLTPEHIRLLVSPFRDRPDTQVSTLKIRLAPDEVSSPNVNKVVCGVDGRALYFSKYPIPYDRDGIGVTRFKHPGFYAYRKPALDAFHRLAPSPLELTEKLEQLRFLENGIDIVVLETTEPTIGVDTEADLQAVAALMAERGRTTR
ncbi:MAG: 3-deoxy-manno-octulosonate cytidylyltransferase [Candidatus Rokuibacteriota bacterium]|nr:MAG: 3-deoxy-manno-octulosonate cytidylyltransferase [Candidatus Rokubacteria bacterium]